MTDESTPSKDRSHDLPRPAPAPAPTRKSASRAGSSPQPNASIPAPVDAQSSSAPSTDATPAAASTANEVKFDPAQTAASPANGEASSASKPETSAKLNSGQPQNSLDRLPPPVAAPSRDEETNRNTSFLIFAAMPSWLVSLVLHLIILLLLTLWSIPLLPPFNTDLTIGQPDITDSDLTNLEENTAQFDVNMDAVRSEVAMEAPEITTDSPTMIDEPMDLEATPMSVQLSNIGFEATESTDLMQEIGSFSGSGLDGRSAAERTRLVREAGGTEGSEAAVKRALQWLKRHQSPDGGWNFFHLGGRCPCKGHGEMAEARIGATSMALLPFLGAGNTHRTGNYQAEVEKGLYFLLNSQKPNGSLWEDGGAMYSHGLAAIVLCEAYAMSGDRALKKPAQAALNFIAYAQDPITKGWRYKPRDLSGGDTSVVGWQLMALKSGHMAQLQVNAATIAGTKQFLNSVQANNGATYGYMGPGEKNSTTAIGLLCRMYLGWDRENEALADGIERLSKSGPSKTNLYFDYYATQTLRHYEGPAWDKWNGKMRDYLVMTQNRQGHADGSWYLGKEHTNKGGRLYCTAMATMILEVYYRHLPIYGKKAAAEEFQL